MLFLASSWFSGRPATAQDSEDCGRRRLKMAWTACDAGAGWLEIGSNGGLAPRVWGSQGAAWHVQKERGVPSHQSCSQRRNQDPYVCILSSNWWLFEHRQQQLCPPYCDDRNIQVPSCKSNLIIPTIKHFLDIHYLVFADPRNLHHHNISFLLISDSSMWPKKTSKILFHHQMVVFADEILHMPLTSVLIPCNHKLSRASKPSNIPRLPLLILPLQLLLFAETLTLQTKCRRVLSLWPMSHSQ